MGVTRTYRKQNERPLVSYSFADIASGTGMTKFIGFSSFDGTTTAFNLLTTAVVCETISTAVTQNDSDTKNFDSSEFTGPQTIEGTGYLVVGHKMFKSSDNEGTTSSLDVTLIRYDGSTENTIVAVEIDTTLPASTQTDIKRMETIPLVIPKTTIQVGDTLRLKITLSNSGSSQASSANYYHDPQNASVADIDQSRMDLYIPFEIPE